MISLGYVQIILNVLHGYQSVSWLMFLLTSGQDRYKLKSAELFGSLPGKIL